MAVIYAIFLRHITGGEGVVGSNPAAPTTFWVELFLLKASRKRSSRIASGLMAQPCARSGTAIARSRAVTRTIGLRTHTCRFEDGSGRWRGSGRCEASRSSPPPTRPSTTTSTMTAPSNAGLASNPSATQPSPSGVSSRLRDAAHPDF